MFGFDNFPGPDDVQWRVEKRSLADGSLLWTQVSNLNVGEDWDWGVAVDALGIYVVGFDSSVDINNIQWRIEKISAEVATFFYMQIWFIADSLLVLLVILLLVIVITQHRKKNFQVRPALHHNKVDT